MSAPVLRITDRLRGKYTLAINDGAGPLNGSDTFTRHFETPPIQHEAAALIDELVAALSAILHTYDDGGVPLGRAFKMANAALAKALGEPGQDGTTDRLNSPGRTK